MYLSLCEWNSKTYYSVCYNEIREYCLEKIMVDYEVNEAHKWFQSSITWKKHMSLYELWYGKDYMKFVPLIHYLQKNPLGIPSVFWMNKKVEVLFAVTAQLKLFLVVCLLPLSTQQLLASATEEEEFNILLRTTSCLFRKWWFRRTLRNISCKRQY